jgi:AcrR family transcriptional regulator
MARRLPATERREAILGSSTALFARRGFSGVKTREIARAAGISEAMVFRHFPRKADLYRAILRRHVRDLERTLPLDRLAASDAPPEEFLGGIAANILGRIDADPTLLRLMFFSALEDHPLAREMERIRARGLRGAIESYLARRIREGVLRPVDVAVASRSFIWMVVGLGLSRNLFRERGARAMDRDTLVADLVAQFLGGLRPVAARGERR